MRDFGPILPSRVVLGILRGGAEIRRQAVYGAPAKEAAKTRRARRDAKRLANAAKSAEGQRARMAA